MVVRGGAWSKSNTTLDKRSDNSALEASTRGAVIVNLRREEAAITIEKEKVLCTNKPLDLSLQDEKRVAKACGRGGGWKSGGGLWERLREERKVQRGREREKWKKKKKVYIEIHFLPRYDNGVFLKK